MRALTLLTIALSLTATSVAFADQPGPHPDDRFTNSDGSITIAFPTFKFEGESHPMSSQSDLNGVCQLEQLGVAVAHEEVLIGTAADVVVVTAAGRMLRTEMSEGILSSVTCRPQGQ